MNQLGCRLMAHSLVRRHGGTAATARPQMLDRVCEGVHLLSLGIALVGGYFMYVFVLPRDERLLTF